MDLPTTGLILTDTTDQAFMAFQTADPEPILPGPDFQADEPRGDSLGIGFKRFSGIDQAIFPAPGLQFSQ